jgi:excisionase family DNA binding protein
MKNLTLADIQKEIAELASLVGRLSIELARRDDASVRLLKPAEVAVLFGYTKSKVYDMIDRRDIPSIRTDEDGTLRVPLIALQAWVLERLKDGKFDVDTLSKLLSFAGSNDEASGVSRL